MHGIIFHQLRSYAEARMGSKGWDNLIEKANLGQRTYLAFKSYPDAEAVALVTAAVEITKTPARALLEDFGEFIAPSLLKTYKVLIKPEWTIIDVVEHVERVHDKVRNDPEATPPKLRCVRLSKTQVNVTYDSPRKLCGVGIGFVRGLAKELGNKVIVNEATCMHRGAPSCEFQVQLVET